MIIKTAKFVTSQTDYRKCPPVQLPEYAFIGRSNVGKSSLINMLTNHSELAKVSSKPGKTQTINHYLIDDIWYLADLPGYGWAKVSKVLKERFGEMIESYLRFRANLVCSFVLIDIRLPQQPIDTAFMAWLAENGVPFAIIFTKADKLSPTAAQKHLVDYLDSMRDAWEELPAHFLTSAETKQGKIEVLNYINQFLKK